jgi:hypothetical protein
MALLMTQALSHEAFVIIVGKQCTHHDTIKDDPQVRNKLETNALKVIIPSRIFTRPSNKHKRQFTLSTLLRVTDRI